MRNLKQLANQFRQAIEMAVGAGEFDGDCELENFRRFPRGCCGDACDLLAHFLLENGIGTSYVCGTYYDEDDTENNQPHAWLLTDDPVIVDITGDQFKNNLDFLNYDKPVYVGVEDDFHRLFEVEYRNVHKHPGLDGLGNMCQPRMHKLYQKIAKYIS